MKASALLFLGLLLVIRSPGLAQEASRHDFHIPASDATVSLAELSRQSGGQIIFLVDAVRGVKTHPVIGRFTVRQAVDRLLFGTELAVTEDPTTGALAVARRPRAPELTDASSVLMNRFIVAATRTGKSPWRYASADGIEILSRANDRDTYWIFNSLERGRWVQNLILPPECRAAFSVPPTVIIDDEDINSGSGNRVRTVPLRFAAAPDASIWGGVRTSLGYGSITAIGDDAYAKNVNVFHVNSEGMLTDSGWGLQPRLIATAPPLPDWLLAGLIGQFGLMRESFAFVPEADTRVSGFFRTGAVDATWLKGLTLGRANQNQPSLHSREIRGPGTLWLSLANTKRLQDSLKENPGRLIPLLPLNRLFSPDPPAEPIESLWGSEAALFARWALLGPSPQQPARIQALSQLLQRARGRPVTEELFTACFGFGYAAMNSMLESYLRQVIGQPVEIGADLQADPLELSTPPLKQASPDQIGRILGDWLRMKGNDLQADRPELAAEFRSAAGRILQQAYENEQPTDPEFLAVFGLYQMEVGHDQQALRLLETAARAGVVRPSAYLALAQLRYRDAAAHPTGPNGKLSPAEVAAILEPLDTARKQSPASAEVYHLIAAVWAASGERASAIDLHPLEEGCALFPDDAALQADLEKLRSP